MQDGIDIATFAQVLQAQTQPSKLHISLPLLSWTFADDNRQHIAEALSHLPRQQPVLVRQFTNFRSDLTYPNDKSQFLPLKRLAAFIVDPEHDRVIFLSKSETKQAFSTDANTGEPIPPPKDVVFVDAKEMWDRLS